MRVMSVSLGLANGPSLDFNVAEAVAVINSQGMAMRVEGGGAKISGETVSLDASADILLNTSSVQIDLDGKIVESGPYLRVEVGTDEAKAKLNVGSVGLEGRFVFDQSIEKKKDSGGVVISETLTRVAVDQAKLSANGQDVATADGAMIFNSKGVAGVLAGDLAVEGDGVGIGAAVSVKINTTGTDVNQSVSLKGRDFVINLGPITDGTDKGFKVEVSSFNLRIGEFILVEGEKDKATIFAGILF